MKIKQTWIDPPKKRDPGSWPGSQTEPSNNSGGFPQGNSSQSIRPNAPKVNPMAHYIVGMAKAGTMGSGSRIGVVRGQQKLLDRLHPSNRCFGLLLALHGEMRPDHCEDEIAFDDWQSEIVNRVKKAGYLS